MQGLDLIFSKIVIQKILKQFEETGGVREKKRGGNPPKKSNDEQIVKLVGLSRKLC